MPAIGIQKQFLRIQNQQSLFQLKWLKIDVAELPEFSHATPKESSDIYIQIGSKSSLIIPDNYRAETLARIFVSAL